MTYRKILGPSLEEGFTVQQGIVCILGLTGVNVILTAGASWPGLAHLPAALDEQIAPDCTLLTPEAQVIPAALTQREQELALANIEAQLLRQGLVHERLQRIPKVRCINRETLAAIIGCSRESVSKGVGRTPRRRSHG